MSHWNTCVICSGHLHSIKLELKDLKFYSSTNHLTGQVIRQNLNQVIKKNLNQVIRKNLSGYSIKATY